MKRSIDECEVLAKKTITTAERRSEESKNPGEGMDISQLHVARKIGAASIGESDAKFDETLFVLTNSARREYEGQLYYDTV